MKPSTHPEFKASHIAAPVASTSGTLLVTAALSSTRSESAVVLATSGLPRSFR
ncbi:TPA: hypothetical protein N0F65_007674 [Lagenidium giganteum]|uniref:Uncharacterized protein n=1 Tax=Lagenidium giganteum TaxID=4803 RepID=A0AAV2ZA67_9STRA|nr:TPA: hypothetical protein N0F65_007674 [Lagenidium giganteum]